MKRKHERMVGVVARVRFPMRQALNEMVRIFSEGERGPGPTVQEVAGGIVDTAIVERWADLFPGISFAEYCQRVKRGERVNLRSYHNADIRIDRKKVSPA